MKCTPFGRRVNGSLEHGPGRLRGGRGGCQRRGRRPGRRRGRPQRAVAQRRRQRAAQRAQPVHLQRPSQMCLYFIDKPIPLAIGATGKWPQLRPGRFVKLELYKLRSYKICCDYLLFMYGRYNSYFLN